MFGLKLIGPKLIGLRVGVLGGLIVVTDVFLADDLYRDLAVLLGQMVVEWLLLGVDTVQDRSRNVSKSLRIVHGLRRKGDGDELLG